MSAKSKSDKPGREVVNRKAFHNFEVGERFEAGMVLTGTEVKSFREGNAQISEAFVRVTRGEPMLLNAYIDEYAFGNLNNHIIRRTRKLLLHKKEIARLQMAQEAEGYTVIPIRMYMKGALVKLEIALCRGKKVHDKREDLKKKADLREAQSWMKRSSR